MFHLFWLKSILLICYYILISLSLSLSLYIYSAPFLSKSGLIRNDREIGDTLYEIWKSQQQQSDEEYDDKINHIANILKIGTKSYYRSIVNDIEEYMLKLGFLPGKLCSTDTEVFYFLIIYFNDRIHFI